MDFFESRVRETDKKKQKKGFKTCEKIPLATYPKKIDSSRFCPLVDKIEMRDGGWSQIVCGIDIYEGLSEAHKREISALMRHTVRELLEEYKDESRKLDMKDNLRTFSSDAMEHILKISGRFCVH